MMKGRSISACVWRDVAYEVFMHVYSFLVLVAGVGAIIKAPCYEWNCIFYTEVGRTIRDVVMFTPFRFYVSILAF